MASFRASFLLVLLLSVLSFTSSIRAHHGNAIYDTKTTLALTGTVTNLTLANPHSWVEFDVKGDKGGVTHWVVEFGILKELVAQGWTNDTLKPGDQVKVQLHPKRDGDPGGILVKEITYADGRSLPLNPPPAQHSFRAVHW
jgi:hypothetical protein